MKKINSTRKKGFTIVELVVAMAVIVIVSTTAISLVSFQNRNYLRTTQTLTATNMAENAIECFRWAGKNPMNSSVEEAFEVAYKATLNGIEMSETNEGSNATYTLEANGMTITIELSDGANTLNFEAVAKEGEKVILQRSYTR